LKYTKRYISSRENARRRAGIFTLYKGQPEKQFIKSKNNWISIFIMLRYNTVENIMMRSKPTNDLRHFKR